MKRAIVWFVAGCIAATAFSARAEVVQMIGKQVEGVFDLTINNQKMEYQTVLIDGTTYAPVRMLGEATGYIVRFDNETGVKLVKKITTPKAVVIKSIEGINSSIATTQRMILAKEAAIAELKLVEQNDAVTSDIKNAENSIQRWKQDIIGLNEQITKLNQTILDIDAQESELSK